MKKEQIVILAKDWKSEMKTTIDFLRSIGENVIKRKDDMYFNLFFLYYNSGLNQWKYLCEHADENNILVDNSIILTMPKDMPKLKAFLGVDVPAKSVEAPKDGEVWIRDKLSCGMDRYWVNRVAKVKGNAAHTHTSSQPNENYIAFDGCCPLNSLVRKATTEEEARLIEAEHANGYHWDGKELVKIPEYALIKKDSSNFKSATAKKYAGKVVMVGEYNTIVKRGNIIQWVTIKEEFGGVYLNEIESASTKEAYEAQEALKQFAKDDWEAFNFHGHFMCPCVTNEVDWKDYIKRTDLIVQNAELKQTIKTLSSTADTLAQENAEMTKKLYKIKGIL